MNDYLLVTPSGVKYDCPSSVTNVNVNELIHLWLGHKKVLSYGWYGRWRYSASTSREVFLDMAKGDIKSDIRLSVIFGKYSSLIIPALIEMGIFNRVTDELLQKAESLTLAKRKEIADIISKSEVDTCIYRSKDETEVYANKKFIAFYDSRKKFCESISSEFCESKIAELAQKVKTSHWYELDGNLKIYKDEVVLWTEESDTNFPVADLIDVQERCFSDLLGEVNLLKYSEKSIATFLQDYASNIKLSQLLIKFLEKSDHKELVISLCLRFSKGEDLPFRFVSEEFLLDKIRKGKCDDCLHSYLLSSSLVFGPEMAKRVINWITRDSS